MSQGIFLNDRFILTLIFINSATIFLGGFDTINHDIKMVVNIIDSVITFLFLVEATVKIRFYGWKNYIMSSWNKLDFILVILSLPSIFIIFYKVELATDWAFLLVFRISRVFKFIRFFKFIPGIVHLMIGIRRAMKTSVFVLLGFVILNFVLSVLSCYLFKEMSPEYFGNPLSSFYSTFRIFTVEGWYEIPDHIAKDLPDVWAYLVKFYFVIILITGGIFGLSIVNSIFVDSMVADNTDELEIKVDELNKKIEKLIEMQQKNN